MSNMRNMIKVRRNNLGNVISFSSVIRLIKIWFRVLVISVFNVPPMLVVTLIPFRAIEVGYEIWSNENYQ